MDRLADYRGKRDPGRTPEPVPDAAERAAPDGQGGIFVVQEHHARRPHWDFRLERDPERSVVALPAGLPRRGSGGGRPGYARPAVWVEPRLVIEVTFDRWTKAGRMRAPVYHGLRDDKDPADVVRET